MGERATSTAPGLSAVAAPRSVPGMRDLDGKVAVITGGGSGIGRGIAEALAARGMKIVLGDINAARLREVQADLAERGTEVLPVECDTTSAASVQALAEAALERFGGVHVACNNAGVAGGGDPWNGPIDEWEWVLGVNLWGVIHGVRAFLPIMREQGEGHIVNTASMAGFLPMPGYVAYTATKHAVVGLSEGLFAEQQTLGTNVGVSVLCPGFVRTQLMSEPTWSPTSGAPTPTENPVVQGVEQMLTSGVETGRSPREVGDLVADAVQAGQFWILTDESMRDAVLARYTRAMDQRNPGA